MAKCAVCGKSVQFGHNVSHSHKKTNRMWKPNIKHVRCKVNGVPKRLYDFDKQENEKRHFLKRCFFFFIFFCSFY